MTELPILFRAPMVRAILDGRKTQTRRVVKNLMPGARYQGLERDGSHLFSKGPAYGKVHSPYGQPGDRLWVREAWRTLPGLHDDKPPRDLRPDSPLKYEADNTFSSGSFHSGKLRPSRCMPRWASRITLEIVTVRVERLQACNEFDARQEGSFSWAGEQETPVRDLPEARLVYRQLWESINGHGSWDANPWVWVVEFKRIDK